MKTKNFRRERELFQLALTTVAETNKDFSKVQIFLILASPLSHH